ncbi:MAG TPA: decaprenyl-phosphate phosphoribosyltransferase [Fimbriimonadaceae bacterium]|nr:decaprenyl-phosphate phosphoribosyltransferase [Fimbriimonadaceae bacterium]
MRAILRLLRPKQWTKNLLVFAAPLFVLDRLPADAATRSGAAFLAMCLLSSAVYVFNDVLDAPHDRQHPVKRNRPVASGQVSVASAVLLGFVLLASGLLVAWGLGKAVFAAVVFYLLLQVAYNAFGRHVPLTDVFLISVGFVLRAALGAIAIGVTISAWLLLCTGALALLLGFGKRRSEFVSQGEERGKSRASLLGYSRQALDALVVMCATGAALCYGVYAVESPTAKAHPSLLLSSVFVVYGIARYMFLVFGQDEGGEPESLLLKDPHIIVSVLGFVASAVFAIGGYRFSFID